MRVPKPKGKAALLGIGLDNEDGHIRATRGENFHIIGGSHETHQAMQEKCIKFNEKLAGRGKRLEELKGRELIELAAECEMNVLAPKEPDRQEPDEEEQ